MTVIKLAVILFVVSCDCSDVVYTGILQKLYGIRLAFLEMLGASFLGMLGARQNLKLDQNSLFYAKINASISRTGQSKTELFKNSRLYL